MTPSHPCRPPVLRHVPSLVRVQFIFLFHFTVLTRNVSYGAWRGAPRDGALAFIGVLPRQVIGAGQVLFGNNVEGGQGRTEGAASGDRHEPETSKSDGISRVDGATCPKEPSPGSGTAGEEYCAYRVEKRRISAATAVAYGRGSSSSTR